MFAGKKSAQIREILISESAWEEMTCLFAPSLAKFNKLKHQGLEITFMLRTISVHTGDADRTLCS